MSCYDESEEVTTSFLLVWRVQNQQELKMIGDTEYFGQQIFLKYDFTSQDMMWRGEERKAKR